jgi:hypothetical protein
MKIIYLIHIVLLIMNINFTKSDGMINEDIKSSFISMEELLNGKTQVNVISCNSYNDEIITTEYFLEFVKNNINLSDKDGQIKTVISIFE